jgi:hypothetical protein
MAADFPLCNDCGGRWHYLDKPCPAKKDRILPPPTPQQIFEADKQEADAIRRYAKRKP